MNEQRSPAHPIAPPAQPHPAPAMPRVAQPTPGAAPIARPAPGIAAAPAARPTIMPRPGIAQSQTIPRPNPAPGAAPAAAPAKPQATDSLALEDEIVELEADSAPAAAAPSKIKFGAEVHRHHDWKRQPTKGGTGACRVRTFHSKISDQGVEYIDEAINMWLDANPDIDIKFVTTNVGMFDGKIKDFALLISVWY